MQTNVVDFIDVDDNTVWTMAVDGKSRDFIHGLLYGAFFLLEKLPEYRFIISRQLDGEDDDVTIETLDDLNDYYEFMTRTLVPIQQVRKPTENDIIPGYYTVWLRSPENNHPDAPNPGIDLANLVLAESPDFFQGLFTSLNAANIRYDRVVLYKPIKDGVVYNIQGINLGNILLK